MADTEQITIEVDERPAVQGAARANAAMEGYEKTVKTTLDSAGKLMQAHGDTLVRVTDKSRSSLDNLLRSMERQSALAGKTGADRLIAERDLLIRKWGEEERAVQAITKAYDKMIAAEQGGGGSKWKEFGDQVKNAIQNPLQAAGSAASGLLEKLGPMGAMVSAGAVAFGAYALACFSAAKSLGEYGVQIRDVELRTGMSAKEVGQFSYAARAVGQDVGIFERMMRGLSQAMDENSTDGEKARAMLQRLHVTLYDATTGGVKPTAQALQEIGAALGKLPAGMERDAAAMALFKRAGIEAIPVMVELAANYRTAKEKDYGISDEEVERLLKYQKAVAQIETSWGLLVLHFKEAIVPSFDNGPEKIAPATSWIGRARNWMLGANAAGEVGKPTGFLGLGREFPGAPAPFVGPIAPGPTALTSAQQAAIEGALSSDTQTGAMRAAQKELEKTQTELRNLQGLGAPWEKVGPVAARAEQEKAAIEGMKAAAEDAKKSAEQLKQFRTQAAEFEKKGDEAELSAIEKIYYQRDLLLKQAAQVKATEADIAAIRKSADEQASLIMQKSWEEFEKYDQKRNAERSKEITGLLLPSKEQTKEWGDIFGARERIEDIGGEAQREVLRRRATREAKAAETPEEGYRIRVDLAVQLAEIEVARIQKEDSAAKRMEMAAHAQKDLYTELAQAQDELDAKRAAAEQQRTEELQRQVDEIQKVSSGLLHTLFTKPGDFPKQLGNTIREATLKPVTEGIGGMIGTAVQPLIYGSDGKGGIAGMFHGAFGGHADPMKLSTDMNTAVTVQNSAALATLTAILAGSMGMAAPAIAMPAGIAGLSLPAISAPAVSGQAASVSGGFSPIIGGAGGIGLGGGPSMGLPALLGGGAAGNAAGGGILPALMSAGRPGGAPTGMAGILKNFKGMNWGGLTHGPDVYSTDANGSDIESQGRITGVNGVAGAALFTGGSMLAQQGLLGSSRGTWGGVGMGAAGGAMIGMQMGGPLGAAIGAGAGALAGIGEKLAGVETPENEAKRLIKQIYSLTINDQTARQIAELAKQKYGNSVSMAVRSPEVRQILQLYAESTGQKSGLFLSDPHGVNLTQAGGVLNQSAVYNNGTAYTYASNLPVLGPAGGGIIPTGNPYAGSGPVIVQVSAEQTANLWSTGTAAAIAGGPRAVADSAVNGQMAGSARINGANTMLSPDTVAF